MGRFRHLDNLALYRTPKERLREILVGSLSLAVACVIAWGLGRFLVSFVYSGSWLSLLIASALAALIVRLLRWLPWVRRFWVPVTLLLVVVAALGFPRFDGHFW